MIQDVHPDPDPGSGSWFFYPSGSATLKICVSCGSCTYRKEEMIFGVENICTVLYCPARWIRPKVGTFDRPFLKETSRRLFRKIHPYPIKWEPFNSRAPSRTVLAIKHSMSKCAVRRTALWLRLWFYIIQGFTNAQRKKSFSMAKGGINIFWLSSIILHW